MSALRLGNISCHIFSRGIKYSCEICTAKSMNNKPEQAAASQKLRILALHGYRQNAEVFRQKTGSFRKMLQKFATFTYITAPHKVTVFCDANDAPIADIGQSTDTEQYGWFFNRDDNTYRGIRKGGPVIGFDESVKLIEDVFEKDGPFDGIVGFSQGACFLGLLCSLQQRGLIRAKFNFAVMSSGFQSYCTPHRFLYDNPVNLPSLHIYGETDEVIPTEMSRELQSIFVGPLFVQHPGGHYLPASSPQKAVYHEFFKNMLLKKERTVEEKEVAIP